MPEPSEVAPGQGREQHRASDPDEREDATALVVAHVALCFAGDSARVGSSSVLSRRVRLSVDRFLNVTDESGPRWEQLRQPAERQPGRLAPEARERILAETAPGPSQAHTRVTFHLPFDFGVELWREKPSTLAAQFSPPTDPEGEIGLQQYSERIRDELLWRLPHKIWEQVVESPVEIRAFRDQLNGDGVAWSLNDARVSLWNGGAGLLIVSYAMDVPSSRSWVQLSKLIDDTHTKIRESSLWREAMALTAEQAHRDLLGDARTLESKPDPIWRPPTFSWCHATAFVELERWDEVSAQAIAETLVWDGVPCERGAEAQYGVVRVALSACHVTYVGGDPSSVAEAAEVQRAIARMVSVHTAAWQTLQSCELVLLEMTAEWRTHRHERMSALDSRNANLLGLYEAMQACTGSLRNVDVHLSALDGAIWRTLSEKWGLERRLDTIDDRLRILRDLYSTAATAASARRTRRFASFAWLFTLLGAVSTGLALVRFIAPDQSPESRVISLAVAIGAIVLVSLGFWIWQRGETGDSQPQADGARWWRRSRRP